MARCAVKGKKKRKGKTSLRDAAAETHFKGFLVICADTHQKVEVSPKN